TLKATEPTAKIARKAHACVHRQSFAAKKSRKPMKPSQAPVCRTRRAINLRELMGKDAWNASRIGHRTFERALLRRPGNGEGGCLHERSVHRGARRKGSASDLETAFSLANIWRSCSQHRGGLPRARVVPGGPSRAGADVANWGAARSGARDADESER